MQKLIGLAVVCLLILQVSESRSADPAPGPIRPKRGLRFEERPDIPLENLHFANDELKREARLVHDAGEALAGKDGRVHRYKDLSLAALHPRYFGLWRPKEPDSRLLKIDFEGDTTDGVDRFNRIRVGGYAAAGEWQAQVDYGLGPETKHKFAGLSVFLYPVEKPVGSSPHKANHRFHLNARHVSVKLIEGSLNYELSVVQPYVTDSKIVARRIFTTPEAMREGMLADIAELRAYARKTLRMTLTVYDEKDVSSAEPPRPFPIFEGISAELEARVLKALDAQLDADAELVRKEFRNIHAVVKQALPRELFAAEI